MAYLKKWIASLVMPRPEDALAEEKVVTWSREAFLARPLFSALLEQATCDSRTQGRTADRYRPGTTAAQQRARRVVRR
jgi:hypothetical protein